MKVKILFVFLFLCSIITAQSPFNKALLLNGNKQYLEIPSKEYLNLDDLKDVTIEFMIKAYDTKPYIIYSKYVPDKSTVPFSYGKGVFIDINKRDLNYMNPNAVFFNPYEYENIPGLWRFILGHAGSFGLNGSYSFPKDTGKFIHMALVRGKDGEHFTYINGEKKSWGQRGGTALSYGTNTPLCFGGYQLSLDSLLSERNYLRGEIDEIRIWNVKRSEQNIKSTLRDTLNYKYYSSSDSGLVAYYRIDKIEQLLVDNKINLSAIRDLSINANNAAMVNCAALIDHNDLTSVDFIDSNLPEKYELLQNYPNPFNPVTTIIYQIPRESLVNLKVYDIRGKEIAVLINEIKSPGSYTLTFNASYLSSGVYFYKLTAGNIVQIKKMTFLK